MLDLGLRTVVILFPRNKQNYLINEYKTEYDEFQKQFYRNRGLVTRFASGLRQYYVEGRRLNNEFDLLWCRLMANHMLIRTWLQNTYTAGYQ